MPPLKPVEGVARGVFSGSLQGVPVVNIFHVASVPQARWNLAAVQALATYARAQFVTRFLTAQVSASYTLGEVTFTDLTDEMGFVGTASGNTPGGGGTSSQPANVALTISWQIARHYRGGHPRTYFGGLNSTAHLNANRWQASVVTAWEAAANAFLTDIGTHSFAGTSGALCCVHRVRTVGDPPVRTILDPPLVDVITSASVDSRIDSQRRRLGADL